MKKFLLTITTFVLLMVVPFWGWCYVEGTKMHQVIFKGAEPVTISEEFPQFFEDGPFRFVLYAEGPIKGLEFSVLVGQSICDRDFGMVLLFVTIDEKVHLVAASTFKVVNGKATNERVYKDEKFFGGNGIGSKLTGCLGFPPPSDLERVAPEKKVSI